MNLEQLESFTEVAQLGNFTRAADQLHLAQPSLSRQIAALERDLGAALFRRGRGGVVLTPAGESLMPLARRMLADARSVRREMAELAGLQRGSVRLGATPTLCISLVVEAVAAFCAAHPGVDLHLSEGGSRTLLDELAAGQLDLALVTASDAGTSSDRVHRTPLLAEELVVVSAASAPPIASGEAITLRRLAELPLILFDAGYDLRATTDDAFARAGLTPRVVLEGAEMDAVLRFVERGIAVAVVPALVLVDRPALRSTRLTAPRLTREISAVIPADVAPTVAVREMLRVIAETADGLAAGGAALTRLGVTPVAR